MSPKPPDRPDPGLLQPSRSLGGSATATPAPVASPDVFANVQGHVDTVPASHANVRSPEFANVQHHTDTVAGGAGGSGGGQTYTVQPGDTLSAIAHRFYGRASHWHAIFEANRDQLDDPDLIRPGQVLALPASDDAAPGR
jgi:nucleoid-associated protein YgaU